jgi:hypothetical protein
MGTATSDHRWVKTEEQLVAAGHSIDPARWQHTFEVLMGRIASRFGRVEPRRHAREFVLGLLAGLPRKNCWTLAEHAGHTSPDQLQHLLARVKWDADAVRDDLRGFVVDQPPAGNPVMSAGPLAATGSATASPGRTRHLDERHVFVGVPGLPARPVDVILTLTGQDGASVLRERVRVIPRPVAPAGSACSPGGPQAHLRITGQGQLVLRDRSVPQP